MDTTIFEDRAARTRAKQALADKLGVRTSSLDTSYLYENPLKSVQMRKEKAENARKARQKCEKYAQLVKYKMMKLENAAKQCNVSERQMSRYVARCVPNEV